MITSLPFESSSYFPIVHFWTYKRYFLSQYCQAWVRLDLDTLLSQQALREALDPKEVLEAKERLTHITQLAQVSGSDTAGLLPLSALPSLTPSSSLPSLTHPPHSLSPPSLSNTPSSLSPPSPL